MSLLATAALAFPATSQALDVPANTTGYDAIAAAHWGGEGCNGQIDIRWDHLGPATNAHASWLGVPGDASTYTDCSITYSLDVAWDPAKLCTIDEHEHGHLLGHDHDDSILMNAYYVGPTPECLQPQTAASQAPSKSIVPAKIVPRHRSKHRRHNWRRHSSQSLELGIQDAGASQDELNAWGSDVGAQWQRLITSAGNPTTAQQIRDAHAAGRHVILTIGGNGTNDQHPGVAATLRWIAQLPRAERYTWTNEPDLVGPTPCIYRHRWMMLRRVLGGALLWGDTSPIKGLGFTKRAAACGRLPQPLPVAAHPYQASDPLAPGKWDLGIGSLPRARRTLAKLNVRVQWWITEFGYGPGWQHRDRIDDETAAWLWPRALTMARHIQAKVLIIYTAQGATWDTRPGQLAWDAIRASL